MKKNIVKIYKIVSGPTKYFSVRVLRNDIYENYEQFLDSFPFSDNLEKDETTAYKEAIAFAKKMEMTPIEPVEQNVYTTSEEPENIDKNIDGLSEL